MPVPSDSPLAAPPDPVERIIDGKYDICQRVAAGGVGTVYRARHRFTGRLVALKLLNEQYSRDKAMSERFLREAKAAAEIGHPNIVDVVDAGVDESVGVYVAFELLEGFDLAEALRRKSLSIGQILDVADVVLDALEAAHQAGIIHRDVKPPNIFLVPHEDGSLNVRVLDFGAAKRQRVNVEESLTTFGTVIGTPAYMSPEQASGQTVDPRADVWSVGAVLFRCLADRPPFAERNPSLLLACIIRDTAPSLAEFRPDLPPAVIAVVDKALAHDAALRWPSAKAMREALKGARAHASEPLAAPASGRVSAPVPQHAQQEHNVALQSVETTLEEVAPEAAAIPPRKNRVLVASALAAAAATGIAASVLWTRSPRLPDTPAAPPATALASQPLTSAASASATLPVASASVLLPAAISAAPAVTSANPANPLAAPTPRVARTAPAGTQRPPVAPIREYE